ncbi:MAG: aspartate 1-decarboxylase [Candidatus Sabulitectum sp.]|nr:aspartate 1-decarboxylase [Candidatus Sabulitectum sp.]
MLRCFLKSKLHRMVVTQAELDYIGSITIDQDLMDKAGLLQHEKVLVADIDTGNRFETYVLPGDRGSGTICINGAAARLCDIGDRVIILQFAWLDMDKEPVPGPVVIVADEANLNPVELV